MTFRQECQNDGSRVAFVLSYSIVVIQTTVCQVKFLLQPDLISNFLFIDHFLNTSYVFPQHFQMALMDSSPCSLSKVESEL